MPRVYNRKICGTSAVGVLKVVLGLLVGALYRSRGEAREARRVKKDGDGKIYGFLSLVLVHIWDISPWAENDS